MQRRFITWCAACDWNVDPAAQPPAGVKEQALLFEAARRGNAMFTRLADPRALRQGLDASRVGSLVIALLVHIPVLGLITGAALVLLSGAPHISAFIVAGCLLLVAFLVMPQFGEAPGRGIKVTRERAPAFFALADAVAASIGARPIHLLVVSARVNASHAVVGIRRRRVLEIGFPLWLALSREARAGLVAHELAHQVNGDLSHGFIVSTGLRTLAAWEAVLRAPFRRIRVQIIGSMSFIQLGESIATALLWVFRVLVSRVRMMEQRLVRQSQSRAEYFADSMAVEVVGTAAMLATLDVLFLDRSLQQLIEHLAKRAQVADLWSAEQEFLAELPPLEWERQRRIGARRGYAVDATHPPTHLRIQMIMSRQPAVAAKHLSVDWPRIDAELRSPSTRLEIALRDRWRRPSVA